MNNESEAVDKLIELCNEWKDLWEEMSTLAAETSVKFSQAVQTIEKQRKEIAMLRHLLEESQ